MVSKHVLFRFALEGRGQPRSMVLRVERTPFSFRSGLYCPIRTASWCHRHPLMIAISGHSCQQAERQAVDSTHFCMTTPGRSMRGEGVRSILVEAISLVR